MPQIYIEGVSTLSFPIPDDQIATLVRRAERAPYGKGEKTIVDTSVRKVWQIARNSVRIGGKSWTANFENILSKVSAWDARVRPYPTKGRIIAQRSFFAAETVMPRFCCKQELLRPCPTLRS